MEIETLHILNGLSETLGVSPDQIIKEYTYWIVVKSLSYIALGIAAICVAIKFNILVKQEEREEWETPDEWEVTTLIVRGILLLIASFLIVPNIPDLFTPEAIAIHRLLRDVSGG